MYVQSPQHLIGDWDGENILSDTALEVLVLYCTQVDAHNSWGKYFENIRDHSKDENNNAKGENANSPHARVCCFLIITSGGIVSNC